MTEKNAHRDNVKYADHSGQIPRLKRVIGQLEGIEKMINDRRYCPDIIQQLRAASSAIKALEIEVLKGHLASCIRDSAKNDEKDLFDEKLKDLLDSIKG